MNEAFPPPEKNNVIPIERGKELQKGKAVRLQKQVLHHVQGVRAYRDNLEEKMAKATKQNNNAEEYRLFKQIQHINRHIAVGKVLLEDGNDIHAMADYLESEWRPLMEKKKTATE